MSKIELKRYFYNDIIEIIYNKIYSTGSSRIELEKHFPDEIIKLIQSKLLPDKTSRYVILQELMNKYYNTDGEQYFLKCNKTGCGHLIKIYVMNYNVLRIMSGMSGLAYST